MKLTPLTVLAAAGPALAYWLPNIPHNGLSPENNDSSTYQIFRNVRDFGAAGDGVTDDTAAINLAISSGSRCAPFSCLGNTVTPATVYFPPGIYMVSDSIVDYFYTQIVGDPTDLPVIKVAGNFSRAALANGVIDGNPRGEDGMLAWKAVNMFFRQVKNLVVDLRGAESGIRAVGLHWPSSQATSVSNIHFLMDDSPRTNQTGLIIEEGSGGYLGDLSFSGGITGAEFNNQQYTARNLSFFGVQTAVKQGWNWSWTYKSLNIRNCSVGMEMSSGATGSLSIIDSSFQDVQKGIVATYGSAQDSPEAGSLLVENTIFSGVQEVIVQSNGTTVLAGGYTPTTLKGYLNGNVYIPNGPQRVVGQDPTYEDAPSALIDPTSGKYYERSKPHYKEYSADQVVTARSYGAKGDGKTDDTEALNKLFAEVSARDDYIIFVDAGLYLVTDTVVIPAGAKIVGEALSSVILGYGDRFRDIEKPYPVVQVGKPGDKGRIEWSDMIVSTRGPAPGAKLIEYNLYSPDAPSGIWDVHVRLGGFAGSDLMVTDCPTTPGVESINENCIAAHTSIHITKSAAGLYHENCWIWVSDHDLEDKNYTQITIYAGRGILIESEEGRIWIVGSGSEHHVLYQYQLVNTKNIYMGLIQTETPYFQPNPPASKPFPVNTDMFDPDFASACQYHNDTAACEMAWSTRILRSEDIVIVGAGMYSFFNDYDTACNAVDAEVKCQARIFDIEEGNKRTKISAWNLNTLGSVGMVHKDGVDVALAEENENGSAQTIVKLRS